MANQEYEQSVEQGPLTKFDQPSTKGVNIAGMKGVSLASDQSEDIKARLAQMIAEREAAKSGWQPFLDALTLAGSAPGTYAERKSEYDKRQREADQELFQMRLGIGQLDTEQARLEMARKKAADEKQMFMQALGGGTQAEGAPQSSPTEVISQLDPQTKASLMLLYQQDPKAAVQKMIELGKATDTQKELMSAGIRPGTPQWNAAIIGNKIGSAGDMVEVPDPANQGYTRMVPRTVAAQQAIGVSPAGGLPSSAAPTPMTGGAVAPTPMTGGAVAPTPMTGGAVAPTPMTGGAVAPTPMTGGAVAPTPMTGGTGGLPTVSPTPATTGGLPTQAAEVLPANQAQFPPNPHPRSSPLWAKYEEDIGKKRIELEQERRKKELEVAQQNAQVPIEGKKAEAQAMGKTFAEEQTAFRTAADNAEKVLASSRALVDNVKRSGNLLGLLAQPQKPLSVFMNALDQGVSIGRFGSVTIPGLKDVWVQMHPDAKKVFIDNSQNPNSTQNYKYQTAANSPQRKAEEAKRVAEEQKWIDNAAKNSPTAFESFQRVAMQLRDVELAYSQVMNKGMGSFTENERKLVREAVGADPYRMSPRNVLLKAKAMEAEAANTKDRMQLWEKLQGKYSWEQFKRSPEYKKQSEAFYYRTAAALGYAPKKVPPYSQK